MHTRIVKKYSRHNCVDIDLKRMLTINTRNNNNATSVLNSQIIQVRNWGGRKYTGKNPRNLNHKRKITSCIPFCTAQGSSLQVIKS